MKICENVYKIPGDCNIYLIMNPEPTLIDTSDHADSIYIKSEIEKIIPVNEIKNVLLTHLHYDHAGNVEMFPGAKFYAAKEEIENYQNSSKDFLFHNISKKTDEILRKKLIALPKEIMNLKVIKCPGHTRGSVTFLDKKRKLLFSGDTIFDNGIGRTDFNNSLPGEMEQSVQKLVKEIREGKLTLLSGHDY
jgi:glyoxylase-like metal-dependent hydrolase (beta-lactamase superfamily II)